MKIKVGEYVRLKNGEIFKIDENTTNYYNSNIDYITNEITKHSKNIIDLIEEGDYVNGYKVMHFEDEGSVYDDKEDDFVEVKGKFIILGNEEGIYAIQPKDIKSIVTKEQFKGMEYKI